MSSERIWDIPEGPSLLQYVQERLRHVLARETSYFRTSSGLRPSPFPDREIEAVRQNLQAYRDNLVLPQNPQHVTWNEVERVVTTVALAALNPIRVQWDASRYALKVKIIKERWGREDSRLSDQYTHPNVGYIAEPAVIVDMFGRILDWHLPDVLSPGRTEDANGLAEDLSPLAHKQFKKASDNLIAKRRVSWRQKTTNFLTTWENPRFKQGTLDFAPAWFSQGHQRLSDPLRTSPFLKKQMMTTWLRDSINLHRILNVVLAATHPNLYLAGIDAMHTIRNPSQIPRNVRYKIHDIVNSWPSVFSGMSVIVNRLTPRHRDKHGAAQFFDLLLSCGYHTEAKLCIPELQADFAYLPGTINLICGRVLSHAVPSWQGGERVCMALYMRDAVHERLGISRPDWSNLDTYLRYMHEEFVANQIDVCT